MKQHPKNSFNAAMLMATCLAGATLLAPRVMAAPGDYATYADAWKAAMNARATHDYAKSRDGWENAITMAKGPRQKISAMLGLAKIALEQNQLDEAQKLCQDVLAMPTEPTELLRAHVSLADVYRKQGKSKELSQELKEVQRLAPRPAGLAADGRVTNRLQFVYGPLLGDVTGKSLEQIRVALEALVKDPKTLTFNRANALSLLGDIAFDAQQPTVARDFYTRAIGTLAEPRFYQTRADYNIRLGDACAAEGDWEAARQAYESALPDVHESLKPLVKARRDAAAQAERQNA